jgi:cell division protein FtsQ
MSATRAGSTSQRLAEALRRRARMRADGARARPRPRLPRPQPRVVLAAAAALVLLLAGWFWLRDSSLVAVRTVQVTGVSGAQGTRVRAALEQAGRSMTTLHVRRDVLDGAAAPFSLVKRLEVSTGFPHALRIHVVTNVAVGAIVVDGRRIPVTSDGTLLRDVSAAAALPEIFVRAIPVGERVQERSAVAAVAALAAATDALRTRVEGIVTSPAHGLSLQLSHGPVLWFGSDARLAAKWAAAAAVLADPQAAGATSIDVTAPERPAVGGLPEGAPATGESDVPTPPAGTTTDATGAIATTTATTPTATP